MCTVFLLLGEHLSFAQYYQVRERVKHLQNFDNKTLHYGYFLGLMNLGLSLNMLTPTLSPIVKQFKTSLLPSMEKATPMWN